MHDTIRQLMRDTVGHKLGSRLSAAERPVMVDMEVNARRQEQEHCASITCMIRHYVARRAKVIEDHPHNAE
jgi:hypothetical protein